MLRVQCFAFKVQCFAFNASRSRFQVQWFAFNTSCSRFNASCSRVQGFVFKSSRVKCFAFKGSKSRFWNLILGSWFVDSCSFASLNLILQTFLLSSAFSHSHAVSIMSLMSFSAFHPSSLLANRVSAHTFSISPARRGTIL